MVETGLPERVPALHALVPNQHVLDRDDQRVVRLALTAEGARSLERLASLHLDEITRLGASFGALTAGLDAPDIGA